MDFAFFDALGIDEPTNLELTQWAIDEGLVNPAISRMYAKDLPEWSKTLTEEDKQQVRCDFNYLICFLSYLFIVFFFFFFFFLFLFFLKLLYLDSTSLGGYMVERRVRTKKKERKKRITHFSFQSPAVTADPERSNQIFQVCWVFLLFGCLT